MTEPVGIALIGCGTIGTGVAKLLLGQPERLAARAGRRLELRWVAEKFPEKALAAGVPAKIITEDFKTILNDHAIEIGIELVGGTSFAKQAVLALLAAGKHVVTANKALLAQHGAEIFDTARRHNRVVAFEASVAGGIPLIAVLLNSLTANQITAIQGILNGTCNFILTGMNEYGTSYTDALAEAQRLGYAEADPTLDVDGTDSAHKLAILAQLAFGTTVPLSAIERRGIAGLHDMDIRFARELGYTIKLLAEAWLLDGQLALHVSPVLLRHQSQLAQVRGSFNAINVVGDVVGDTFYYGRGAGQMPTASAVVADIIDVAVGRAQQTFASRRLWSGGSGVPLLPSSAVRSRFYLRVPVADRPGVLADIARVLAQHQISISSVIQHEASDEQEGGTVPLVIMTHTALTGHFRDAVNEINRLGSVNSPSVYYPVAD